MKRIVLLVLVLITGLNIYATPAISNFSIESTYLQNSKIKVYGGTDSYFVASYTLSRSYINGSAVLEEVNAQVRLIAGVTNITELDNNNSFRIVTSSDFVTPTGSVSNYSNMKYIQGIIPESINTSNVFLQIRYYSFSTNTWGEWITSNVNFATINVAPVPVTSAPVADSYPLFAYTKENGGSRFYTTYQGPVIGHTYSSNEIYSGVMGYIFKDQKPGTIPLYEFYHNYDNIETIFYYSTTPTHPLYGAPEKIIGYVYSDPVSKTRPVYQHRSQYAYTYIYVDGPGTFQDFNLDGIAFNLLMSPHPNPTYPLPQEDVEELYQYYSTTGDHFYTTIKKDRPGYVYEKVLGYVHSIPKSGTIPLYRYVNPNSPSGDHYYTTSQQNYGGYTYEGIVGYVYGSSGYANTSAIYSYFAPSTANHYYNTVNTNYGGYTSEGIKFYMLSYNH
jgi:Repeat of unknown function (DUF5648)